MAVFPDVALLVGTIAIFEKKQPAVVPCALHHCHCFPSVATLSSLHFWVLAQGGHFPNQLMTTQSSEWLLYPPSMPAIHSNPWRWNVMDWLEVSFAPGVVGTCRNWRNMGLDFPTLNRVVEYLHRLAANLQETAQRICMDKFANYGESLHMTMIVWCHTILYQAQRQQTENQIITLVDICGKVAIWVPRLCRPLSMNIEYKKQLIGNAPHPVQLQDTCRGQKSSAASVCSSTYSISRWKLASTSTNLQVWNWSH